MSGGHLRTNTSCENCGQEVLLRFCPNCGQENVETRQSFHYLFTHFIEDLTHYENGFWKAIKYLLFSPVTLTKTYLEGKRKKFIAPVKLFIFINFVFFLLYGVIKVDSKEEESLNIRTSEQNKKLARLDLEIEKDDEFYFFQEKIDNLNKKYTPEEIVDKLREQFKHQLPKALFIYLPIFAFLTWLFHNKKKWWYFEHGIFTFHYFSSLLLLLLIARTLNYLFVKLGLHQIDDVFDVIVFIYIVVLFYKSIHQMYHESKWTTFWKATLLFVINFTLIILIITMLILFSFILIN